MGGSSTGLVVADSARDQAARSQRGTPKKTRSIARRSHRARSPLRRRRSGLSLMEPCSARDCAPSEVSALGCRPGRAVLYQVQACEPEISRSPYRPRGLLPGRPAHDYA